MEPKYLGLLELMRAPLAHHLTRWDPGSLGMVMYHTPNWDDPPTMMSPLWSKGLDGGVCGSEDAPDWVRPGSPTAKHQWHLGVSHPGVLRSVPVNLTVSERGGDDDDVGVFQRVVKYIKSGKLNIAGWKMDPDGVDVFPIENGYFPASYVSLPEGNLTLLFWEGNLFLDGVVFLGG